MVLPGIRFAIATAPRLGIRTDRVALLALTRRGPVETPTLVRGPDELAARFGCPLVGTLGALAAQQAFANGAEELVVTRVVPTSSARHAAGALPLAGTVTALPLRLLEPGAYGNAVEVHADVERIALRRGRVTTDGGLALEGVGAGDVGRFVLVHGAPGGESWARIEEVVDGVARVSPPIGVPGVDVLAEIYASTFALRVREPERAERSVAGLDLRDLDGLRRSLLEVGLELDVSALGPSLPRPGGVARFAAGDDGLDVDSDDPVHLDALEQSFLRALDALDTSSLPDLVIAPDLGSRVWRTKGVHRLALDPVRAQRIADEMVRRAARTRDRVVLVDPPLVGDEGLELPSVDELEAWRAERATTLAADRDFAAMPAPWLRVRSDVTYRGDETLLVPPSAAVAGCMARVARERGPWVSAGDEVLEGILGPAIRLDVHARERLQAVGIDPLIATADRTRIGGVRSLAYPDRVEWRFLTTRRLLNLLQRLLPPIGRSYAFEPNGPRTWLALHRELDGVLRDLFERGALAGTTPSQAYFVRVDGELNPEAERDRGVLNAQIGVAPARPLEHIVVQLAVRGEDVSVREVPR